MTDNKCLLDDSLFYDSRLIKPCEYEVVLFYEHEGKQVTSAPILVYCDPDVSLDHMRSSISSTIKLYDYDKGMYKPLGHGFSFYNWYVFDYSKMGPLRYCRPTVYKLICTGFGSDGSFEISFGHLDSSHPSVGRPIPRKNYKDWHADAPTINFDELKADMAEIKEQLNEILDILKYAPGFGYEYKSAKSHFEQSTKKEITDKLD